MTKDRVSPEASARAAFRIFHWDTFANETVQVGSAETIQEARDFIEKKYGDRISLAGADRVEVVNDLGNVVLRRSVK